MTPIQSAAAIDPDGVSRWDFPRPYAVPISPAANEIDGLKHTNNAVYVQWCEATAWAHSGAIGLDLADYQRLDRGMAIRHAEYDYLLPSSLGDELLLATWLTASDGKLSLERRFQLRRVADGETVLRACWKLVCIELSSGRARRMPAEFLGVYLPALAKVADAIPSL
jgi:acyl-CoA thioester hydrolase